MPERWQTDLLGKFCYIKARIGWRGLAASEYTESGPFLIAGKHIDSGRIDWDAADHISEFRYNESSEIALQIGDVILSKDGTIGRVARIDWLPGRATINGTMMLIRPLREIDYRFLYHVLNGAKFKKLIEDKVSGSSIPHIFQRDMVTLPVSFPPLEQQKKLAEILDTLDTAIQETEAIVAKLKAVKQGLLHDLLTRGIDDNGELRPPQSEAPHLYKQSPLGWIPKEWDAGTIGSYLDGEQGIKPGPFGSSIKKEAYSESGFKVYGQEQVIAGDQEIGSYFVPLRKFQELQDFAVEVGDVLISLVGTIGKVLVLKEPLELGIINPRLMRLRPDSRIAHPEFVGLLVSSNAFVSQVVANAGGGTMPVINKRIISSIRVPVVPLNEQQDMLKRKNATDQRISCECSALEKLRALKFGVMDDLLTGRVRVTPLLQEAQHA